MTHFPVDAPKVKVIKTFELLGFSLVREREHIAMIRENAESNRKLALLPLVYALYRPVDTIVHGPDGRRVHRNDPR